MGSLAELTNSLAELRHEVRQLKQQNVQRRTMVFVAVVLGLGVAPYSDAARSFRLTSGMLPEFSNDSNESMSSSSDDKVADTSIDDEAAEAEAATADHGPPPTVLLEMLDLLSRELRQMPRFTTEETDHLREMSETAAAEAQTRAKKEKCKEDPAERRLCSMPVETHRVNLTKTDQSLGLLIYCNNVIGRINNRTPGIKLGDQILQVNGQSTDKKSVTFDILNAIPMGERFELVLQSNETCRLRASFSTAERWLPTLVNLVKLAMAGKLDDFMNRYHHRIHETLRMRWWYLYTPGLYLISALGWHWVRFVVFLFLGCCVPEAACRWLVDHTKADDVYLDVCLFAQWLVSGLPNWLISLILLAACGSVGYHVWGRLRASREAKTHWLRAAMRARAAQALQGLARQSVAE